MSSSPATPPSHPRAARTRCVGRETLVLVAPHRNHEDGEKERAESGHDVEHNVRRGDECRTIVPHDAVPVLHQGTSAGGVWT